MRPYSICDPKSLLQHPPTVLLEEQSFTRWQRKSLPDRFRTNLVCVGFPRLKLSDGELTMEPRDIVLFSLKTHANTCQPS